MKFLRVMISGAGVLHPPAVGVAELYPALDELTIGSAVVRLPPRLRAEGVPLWECQPGPPRSAVFTSAAQERLLRVSG